MARADTDCEVWQQNFLALDLLVARFDGVFANASLFHVPAAGLPRVLRQLHATLKPGGVLFSSNPRGHNEAGWYGDRYGAYHDLSAWRGFMAAAHFRGTACVLPPRRTAARAAAAAGHGVAGSRLRRRRLCLPASFGGGRR